MTEQVSAALFAGVFPSMHLVIDVHGGSTESGISRTRVSLTLQVSHPRGLSRGPRHRIPFLACRSEDQGMLSLSLLEIGIPSISIETGSALTHPRSGATKWLSTCATPCDSPGR
jgi:predicted deacylase